MPASTRGAVVAQGLIPDQWLTTYTMPNAARSSADVAESWKNHGLDPDDLPDARQPVHFFQTACGSVRSRRGHTNGHSAKIEIAADEVANSPKQCVYQITMRVWDLDENTIEHEKALRVSFDKLTKKIAVDHLESNDPRLKELEKAIRDHYRTNVAAASIPGEKVRNAIRRLLQGMGAQNLRRKAGGLYFVPAEVDGKPTRPVLDGLAGFLADQYGADADFDTMPFVLEGNPDLQAMVRKHFILNANAELDDLAAKAVNRVRAGKGRGVRKELIANLWNDRRRITGALEQLQALVGAQEADIAQKLSMFDQAVDQLQKLAEEA